MSRNTVVFRLGPVDLGEVRFAISPNHELIRAIRVLHDPTRYPLQWGWLRRVRGSVPAPAFTLMSTIIRARGYMPDFFTALLDADTTPERDQEHLRSTAITQVRADLDNVRSELPRRDPLLDDLAAHPRAALRRICDAAETLWAAILAPHWEALHRLLVADIARRSRLLATQGLDGTLRELHERVMWTGSELRVRTTGHSETFACTGSGITLVPSAMATPLCTAQTRLSGQPAIFYPVHGLAETWTEQRGDEDRRLAALLGSGRARVLGCLDGPRSTTETARVCALSISTASHHLATLRGAGLIDSTRSGLEVLHSRTVLGDALTRTRPGA